MKKIISLFILLLWNCSILLAQSKEEELAYVKNVDEIIENSKTGNFKDILSSFYQLAVSNLVGEDKSIEFNSTLFALKQKANPELKRDIDFLENTFSRNLEFNFKGNFDDDFKYNGFTGGITYAVVNKRDAKRAKFPILYPILEELTKNIQTFRDTENLAIIRDASLTEAQKSKKVLSLTEAVEAILNNREVNAEKYPDASAYYTSMKAIKSDKELKSLTEDADDVEKASAYLNAKTKELYEQLNGKLLMTLSVDGTSDKDGKFNQASGGLVALQGIKGSDFELDLRGKFIYADTMAISNPRTALKSSLGVNAVISRRRDPKAKGLRDAGSKSCFEIKAYVEYNAVYKNRLPDEKADTFFGSADLRLRIADDLWIPFTVKYDIENANVLGFLNLTYNFGNNK